jgi:hypothetical protein
LWGCWGLLGVGGWGGGEVNRARGATWWWSSYPQPYAKTTSKKPRQTTKSKRHADSDCFTCTRATRANPHRHSSESKDEIWVANHHLAQFRISASRSRYFKPPTDFRANSTCGLASQPTCPDSALDRSVLRDLKATQRCGFEQPKRQEEDDKHTTKPETR